MYIKPGAKKVLVILGVIGILWGGKLAMEHGLIPTPGIMKALVPQKANLPDVKDAQVSNVAPAPIPQSSPANISATLIRGEIWEWNAQMGLLFANGGAQTTQGSLMAKRGVNLLLLRQDDTTKMIEDLGACAKELAGGATQCSTGANFVVIMGDGAGQFAAGINPVLAKLGPKYGVKVIAAAGYSRGEDAFLAPSELKKNPKAFSTASMYDADGNELPAHGLLVEGVLRDGDWNIALKWAGDNNNPNNPDEKTFDPDAINWVNAPDYNQAAADYVSGNKCEDRPLVKGGHLTGSKIHVCVNAVVTWTPGDVTIAMKRGGLVKVVSSKEYRSQMPAVILGPNKFFADNREEITNMVAAMFEGGDQIKAFDQSLHAGAAISSKVYNDEGDPDSHNGEFWYKYFKGVPYRDSKGNSLILGGSAVNNLDDNLILFGLKSGANDNFRSTYTVFANIDIQQYPQLFKETPIPNVKMVEDTSYITAAQALLYGENDSGSEAATPAYEQEASGAVVSNKAVYIQFQTGSGVLTEGGKQQLRELKDSLAITGLFIQIDGYTDNTGSDVINTPLSRERAESVQNFLQQNYPKTFPIKRFAVAGHGSQNPIAPNNTSDGKAKNRRVEITLKG